MSKQLNYPYSDLLLHDMGENLADNRPDFLATGREWRTQPFVGHCIDLQNKWSLPHNGRARSLLEPVLWHGRAAGAARNKGDESE